MRYSTTILLLSYYAPIVYISLQIFTHCYNRPKSMIPKKVPEGRDARVATPKESLGGGRKGSATLGALSVSLGLQNFLKVILDEHKHRNYV